MGLRTVVIPRGLPKTLATVTVKRVLVAMAPNGGWVAATGTTCVHHDVPSEMSAELGSIKAAGLPLDAVAFAPTGGGWTVIAGKRSRSRNVGGNGMASYYNCVRLGLAGGRTVRSIAFNPIDWDANHGFVVVWGDGTTTQRAVPDEMAAKLREFGAAGGVQAVAFTPLGGWTIVGRDRSFTRGVGGPEPSYYETLRKLDSGGTVQTVAFNPQDFARANGWILLTGREFEGRHVPRALASRLQKDLGLVPGKLTGGGIAPLRSVLKIERIRLRGGKDGAESPYIVITGFRGRMGDLKERFVWLHPGSGPLRSTFGTLHDIDFGQPRALEVFGTVTIILDQKSRSTKMERTIMGAVSEQFDRSMSRWSLDLDRLSPAEVRDVAKRTINAIGDTMVRDLRPVINFYKFPIRGFCVSFWIDVPGLTDQQIVMLDESGIGTFGGLRRPGVRFKMDDWFGVLDGVLVQE